MVTLRQACRDYVWLLDSRRGISVAEIAGAWQVGERTVYQGLTRAERAADRAGGQGAGPPAALLRLLPIFPVGPLTPQSACPHHGPLRPGSRAYCVVCDSAPDLEQLLEHAAGRGGPDAA